MIQFANLLKHHSLFPVFWKTVLERLSIGDAPFFARIEQSRLHIEDEYIGLDVAPEEMVGFCREKWTIPLPCDNWKDIKKEYVRSLLLQDFLLRENIEPYKILRLQSLIGEKVIGGEDILFEGGRIVSIRGIEDV
jgi:hypothetical protein